MIDHPAPTARTARTPQELAHREETLIFGITPPRLKTEPDRLSQIAQATLARLEALPLDALAIYDIDDESSRTDEERPFPFIRTLDPGVFLRDHLSAWTRPAVVYRCVGKYTRPELTDWLTAAPDNVASVFVGASSADQPVQMSLPEAQRLRAAVRPGLPLGAVALPERHRRTHTEDARMIAKQRAGCQFFITQIVYDPGNAKDMASDYGYRCRAEGIRPAPLIFTLSLCGSVKTLEFLGWLGVDVPRWIRNELVHADDMLSLSLQQARTTAEELATFCRYLGVPFGFNVESVSNRRVEIEAATELAGLVAGEVLHRRV